MNFIKNLEHINLESKVYFIIGLVILVVLIAFICYSIILAQKKEIERLEEENMLLGQTAYIQEAENLKFQLKPHTLNNILANLRSISSRLNRGMDAFSETLEYILYNGKNHVVSVEEEIGFIKTYLSLNDLFITEIDSIKLNITAVDKKSTFYSIPCIPHLISAYFIENAFKHGDIHHPEFLKINIKLTEDIFELEVINKIKSTGTTSKKGIGLDNMNKRLQLLSYGAFEVKTGIKNNQYFSKLTLSFKHENN